MTFRTRDSDMKVPISDPELGDRVYVVHGGADHVGLSGVVTSRWSGKEGRRYVKVLINTRHGPSEPTLRFEDVRVTHRD